MEQNLTKSFFTILSRDILTFLEDYLSFYVANVQSSESVTSRSQQYSKIEMKLFFVSHQFFNHDSRKNEKNAIH